MNDTSPSIHVCVCIFIPKTDYPGCPTEPHNVVTASGGGFGDQVSWLKADLEKVNRQEQPWIVAMAHRPMYDRQTVDFPTNTKTNFKKAFEDILLQYQVDVFFSGHIHAMERSYPVNSKGQTDNDNGENLILEKEERKSST
jgi:hypothetical protein